MSSKIDRQKIQSVYQERDHVLALAAKMALLAGYHAWIGKVANSGGHGFNYAVYIELPPPIGQVSWHVRNDEVHLFASLPWEAGKWDPRVRAGKYLRIAEWCSGADTVVKSFVPKKGPRQ